MKKLALTLSEVLITLSVIGTIAVLTIPNMVNRYDERIMVTKVKDFYSTLSNALTLAQLDNGPVNKWDIGNQNSIDGSTKIYNKFKPYLKITKDCNSTKEQCFASSYKKLDGNKIVDIPPDLSRRKSFVLKGDAVIAIYTHGNAICKSNDGRCGTIWFDVNGKKGPNIYGVDAFNMPIYYNKELRIGNFRRSGFDQTNHNCSKDNHDSYAGADCLWWILNKGNMDYLHR